MDITFIGGGNMASALIGGLLRKGFLPEQIRVVEVVVETRARLADQFAVAVFDVLNADSVNTDVIVLAVKPQQMQGLASALKPLLARQLVISIAAGIRCTDLSQWLGNYPLLVRVMPNTPAMVMAGVSALYALPLVDPSKKQQADSILAAVGKTLWLEDEALMDGVTALSGSGPAYVFYFIEAMQDAAKELGFNDNQARLLSIQTVIGTGLLAAQSAQSATALRAQVTSKGGTTERALQVMELAEIKRHFIEAIHAAKERSIELGKSSGKPK
jgi:pyrroline-5-carboxylate reductase